MSVTLEQSIYHPGDTVRIGMVYRDLDGALSDPTTIAVRVVDPAGDATDYTLLAGEVTVSTLADAELAGDFELLLDLPDEAAAEGDWTFSVRSTGTPRRVESAAFTVRPNPAGY